MRIKKLEYIPVREIWRDEARDFTRWLAENIDFLNDKLGFNLNVIQTERQIGSFNVDIYAEDEQGNPVIIENQLERTDHSHLGQLLTYAVGTAAKTVIWISPSPREEHVAVVEWLNEVTPVDMSWYLFKIEVVKIGDSPVSPLFTKVSGPSEEIKTLGSEKKELAERHQLRIDFWKSLLSIMNEKTTLFRNISPSKDNWISAGSGVSDIYYQVVIRMSNASIQLVIDRGDKETNKKIFDFFYENRSVIEKIFGGELQWKRMDENISSKVQFDIEKCTLKNKDTWDDGQLFIAQKIVNLENSFRQFIDKVPSLV